MRQRMVPVLVGVAVVAAVLLVGKNLVAKAAVQAGVKAMTGLPLQLERLNVGLFTSSVGIYGMQLHNPAGFSDPVMMDVPEVYVRYDLPGFLARKVHLQEVRLHLKEFVVVKHADGRLNLEALKSVQASKSTQGASAKPGTASQAPSIHIDRLHLQIGTVIYKDYTRKGAPAVQEFPINLDEEYRDITNPYMFGSLVVSRALMSTTVAKLTGFDIGPLQSMVGEQLSGVVSGATEAAQFLQTQATTRVGTAASELTGTAARTVGGAADAGKQAVGTAAGAATNAVKGTTDSLKKLLGR